VKILLIEDELLIQKSLTILIKKRGHNVTAKSSGIDAIDEILNNHYDRIICDLMLQDVSGFDVIEESKKKYSLYEIEKIFVIITAYSSDQVLKKAKAYGCRLLTKPFSDIDEAINIFCNIER